MLRQWRECELLDARIAIVIREIYNILEMFFYRYDRCVL